MALIFIVVGSPGSGKTHVLSQLHGLFQIVPHDDDMHHGVEGYVHRIDTRARNSHLPLAIESPFGVSQIRHPLQRLGHTTIPIFIVEPEHVLRERYRKREGREIPAGHLTRQRTYQQYGKELGAFVGTSDQVADRMKELGKRAQRTDLPMMMMVPQQWR